MDIMNVYVVIDENKFTKEDVVKDLKEEGYKHNFIFSTDILVNDVVKYMNQCHEIWLFGNCKEMYENMVAEESRFSIWQMA